MIFFTELPIQERQRCIEKTWSKFSLSLKETGSWRFEEPKPLKVTFDDDWGQSAWWTAKANSKLRGFYWGYWHCFNKNLHF
jgi:hypothetical protein